MDKLPLRFDEGRWVALRGFYLSKLERDSERPDR
jgi:hypothetical protein